MGHARGRGSKGGNVERPHGNQPKPLSEERLGNNRISSSCSMAVLPKDGHKTKGTDSFNKLMRTYLWK